MKKIIFLFVLTTTLFSCSSDDNSNQTKVLQKVVFYRNSSNEKHWNFKNNLLKDITLADGTIAEEFIYDNQNRLIRDVKYTNGVATETDIINYNADNTIKSINGLPYTFDVATRTYDYTYGSSFTINCQVNSDFLAENFVRTGTNAGEYHMTYANGNMLSFEKSTSGVTDVIKNFHFIGSVVEGGEVFKAILAVARVKSLTDPNFFIDCQVSKNSPMGFDKGITDPYYYNYGAIVNMDGTLLEVGIEVLDSSNNAVDLYSFADYYYQ
ncbi:hypothetical protein QWY90_02860 [Flavobacterium paronense]|uniref:DUF4595 domain-containing protein n=1 Tax=Flavobacterium paronense TaxID=1392775 RepID=A0ABV5GCS3_9FLAO|nr:hypothetical protein [Flavobacterium paronense]MDN3676247.1 hypothetical protein [Flavobacterium paronense]